MPEIPTPWDEAVAAMTREEILEFITEATERLKGPLPNIVRAWLVAHRKDARKELAKRDAAEKKGDA